jgi:DNA-binding NarL/FixJ family response regulator
MTDSPIGVWVVEDNEYLRETVVELVDGQAEMHCTLAADSSEVALEALERDAIPQVMLMDLGLPGMGGIAGIRQIKSRSPTTHIVVLTVHEDDDNVFEALCSGACGYLLKPASTDRIIEAIHLALSGGAPMSAFIARKVLRLFRHHVRPRADYGLTDREREILHLLVEDHTQKEIAAKLFVSPHTVDTHLRNIYAKLQVHSRSGAIVKALRERLL